MKIPYRIGCAGLLADIPLMVAHAKGYLPTEEIDVALSVELGWASIELKLASGQLSAANVPPSFPLLLALKKSGSAQPMQALAITSYHGEAITLNRETAALFQAGKSGTLKTLRIGVDAPYSLSHLFVQSWLKTSRLERNPTVQLVPLAISQLLELLKDGYIQGFCCAEPISQIALESEIGLTMARSRDYPQLHIQSVLAATDTACSAHPGASKAIAAGVERARVYCANPKHEADILRIYRKQMQHRLSLSAQSLGGPGQAPALSSLIGFEPGLSTGHASNKDPFGALAGACSTLPGVTAAEREIREAVKRIFSSLP